MTQASPSLREDPPVGTVWFKDLAQEARFRLLNRDGSPMESQVCYKQRGNEVLVEYWHEGKVARYGDTTLPSWTLVLPI